MHSVPMREAYKAAEAYEETLKGKREPRFNGGLVIVKGLDDMSYFIFSEAFAVSYKDFVIVIPEHNDTQCFHKEEYRVTYVENRYLNTIKSIEDQINLK